MHLTYSIVIELDDFSFRGEVQSTEVRLDSIEFPDIGSWKELQGRTFTFPKNPEDGYIDGSVYLDHVHNPADATRLTFGRLSDGGLPVSVHIDFDFAYQGPEELGQPQVDWDLLLQVDAEQITREEERVVGSR